MEAEKKTPSGNSSRRARVNPVPNCPLTAALAALGGKWKLIIIYWLAVERCHFGELRRQIPSISQKVLTQQLRELQSDGIVQRQVRGRVPSPVVYRLTDYGRTLLPLLEQVRVWGRGHIEHRLRELTTSPASHSAKDLAAPGPRSRTA